MDLLLVDSLPLLSPLPATPPHNLEEYDSHSPSNDDYRISKVQSPSNAKMPASSTQLPSDACSSKEKTHVKAGVVPVTPAVKETNRPSVFKIPTIVSNSRFASDVKTYSDWPYGLKTYIRRHQSSSQASKASSGDTHPKRQVFVHSSVTAFLAIHKDSYTLSNGVKSVTEDSNPNWKRLLLDDLKTFQVGILKLVTFETKQAFKTINIKHLPIKVHNLQNLKAIPRCKFCKNVQCTRWNVIIGGVQQMYNTLVEPIKH